MKTCAWMCVTRAKVMREVLVIILNKIGVAVVGQVKMDVKY